MPRPSSTVCEPPLSSDCAQVYQGVNWRFEGEQEGNRTLSRVALAARILAKISYPEVLYGLVEHIEGRARQQSQSRSLIMKRTATRGMRNED